jgi:putative ABC transport system permease protein
MWRLILHGIWRRRWQSLTVMVGVALGAGVLFAAFLLYYGLKQGLALGRQRLGADLLVVPADAVVDPEKALFAGSPLNVYMDKKYADEVRRIPGVRNVEAQFFTQTLRLECCTFQNVMRVVGVEDGVIKRLAALSAKGYPTLADDEIIVGSKLLYGTGSHGSLVGLLGRIFRISYHLEPVGNSLDYSILMRIDTARQVAGELAPLREIWQQNGPPEQLISALLVEADDPAYIDHLAEVLSELGPLNVIKAADIFQRLKRMMDSFVNILAAAGVVAALGGVIYLAGHLASAVWDRKGEWALYRALGAGRARLAALVLGEALVLAIGGVAPGLAAGFGFYHWALSRLAAQNSFPFVPPAAALVAAAAAGFATLYVAAALLAAWLPAWRIARLEPAPTIARGDID